MKGIRQNIGNFSFAILSVCWLILYLFILIKAPIPIKVALIIGTILVYLVVWGWSI